MVYYGNFQSGCVYLLEFLLHFKNNDKMYEIKNDDLHYRKEMWNVSFTS